MRRCTRLKAQRYILFDEVQYTENWELWMKVIYDSRKDIRLIATGSASPVLEKRFRRQWYGAVERSQNSYHVFFKYCRLLDLDLPLLPDDLRLSELKKYESGAAWRFDGSIHSAAKSF